MLRLIGLCRECNQQERPEIGWTTRIDEIKIIMKAANMPINIERGTDGKFANISFEYAYLLPKEVDTVIESIGFKNGVYKF